MLGFAKEKSYMKAIIAILLVSFPTTVFSSGLNAGRLIPMGKVSAYNGDQKVGEFSAEAPFPEDTLLACEGKCGVRMDGLYLVAIEKSMFSISTGLKSRELTVQEGTIYFAISNLDRSLTVTTPVGVITAQELRLNAAAGDGLVKAYVAVKPESTEMGVIEGGSMLVSMPEGEKVIQAGGQIVLAAGKTAAEAAGSEEAKTPGEETEKPKKTSYAIYGGLALLGLVALGGGGGGGGGGGSSKKKETSPF